MKKCKCGSPIVKKREIRQHVCSKCLVRKNAAWRKKNPWQSSLYGARARCRNKTKGSYDSYGGRGIKCHLTFDEIRSLWFRDGAALMLKPSIDRINPDGNYEIGNCRFIEILANAGARRNVAAKLTDSAVLEMRQMRFEGGVLETIAAKYGVDETTASNAIYGKTWKHVKSAIPKKTKGREFDSARGEGER